MKYQAIDKEYMEMLREQKEAKDLKKLMIRGMQVGYLIFCIVIIVAYSFSGHLVLAVGNDVNYDFDNAYLYNDSVNVLDNTFNTRMSQLDSGNYNATYSFENDIIGTIPSGWSNSSGLQFSVISDYYGHNKVVKYKGVGTYCWLKHTFSNQENISMEFWFLNNRGSGSASSFTFSGSGGTSLQLYYLSSGGFTYYSSTGGYPQIFLAEQNTWYHIRIDIDCTATPYDKFDFYLNGVLILNDGLSYYDKSSINQVYTSGTNTIEAYYDAIGFNFDNYIPGSNWYPEMNDITTDLSYNMTDVNNIEYGIEVSGSVDDLRENDTNCYVIDSDSDNVIITFDMDYMYTYGYLNVYAEFDISVNYLFIYDIDSNVLWFDENAESIDLSLYLNEGYDLLTLQLSDAVESFTCNLDLFQVRLNYDDIPKIDKYEFSVDSEGNPISSIDDIVDWKYSGTHLELIDYGQDNYIKYTSPDYSNNEYLYLENLNVDSDSLFNTTFDIEVVDEVMYFLWYGLDDNIKLSLFLYPTYYGYPTYNTVWSLKYSLSLPTYLNVDKTSFTSLFSFINYVPSNLNVLFYQNFGTVIFGNESENIITSNEGISQIKINFIGYTGFQYAILDSVGIYQNGFSLSNESVSLNFYSLGVDSWNLANYNFIQFTFNDSYQNNVSIMLNEQLQLINYDDIFNDIYFFNMYDDIIYNTPYLYILNSSEYEIVNLQVYGVVMKQDVNQYFLTYDYNSINPNESYFYENGGKLYYKLIADDSNLEYIQATFDITDISTNSYFVSFTHYKSNQYLSSQFKIQYVDSYITFLAKTNTESINTILTQDKIITNFQFLISDNDNDYNGQSIGYISGITLVYTPDITLTITVMNLLNIIPVIILLVLIPLILYKKFKSKIVVIPTIAFMSVICFATGLIPAWLLFIILSGCVGYFVIKQKTDN